MTRNFIIINLGLINKPMAQTALETFWEQIAEILPFSLDSETAIKLYEKYQEAKQMEREQIENAWHNGNLIETQEHYCGEQYYHETYFTRLQNETN